MPFSDAVLINPQVPLKNGMVYPFVDMQTVIPNTKWVRANEDRAFDGGGARFLVGDVLMARITPCLENGKISRFIANDLSILAHGSTEFIVIRGKPGVTDTDFAYYLTRWDYVRQYAISQMTGSSGRQRVPTESLQFIDVTIPPLPKQRAIAGILGALDDKIELNRRMNATLESMMWAIFKSWFIDFEPVHAKVNGQQPIGVDAETARLFPSVFEGDKPKGWEIARFGDFLTPISDRIGSVNAPEYSATIHGLGLRDENFNKTLSKSKDKNKKIVKNNLVFGLSRRTLNYGVMKEDIGSVSPVYEIFKIDTNIYVPELLEMYIRLKMDEHIDILKPAAREGQAIDRDYLLTKKILVPDMKVQMRYQEFCSAFRNKIVHNAKESHTLVSLRGALLPRLMRGEVMVKV